MYYREARGSGCSLARPPLAPRIGSATRARSGPMATDTMRVFRVEGLLGSLLLRATHSPGFSVAAAAGQGSRARLACGQASGHAGLVGSLVSVSDDLPALPCHGPPLRGNVASMPQLCTHAPGWAIPTQCEHNCIRTPMDLEAARSGPFPRTRGPSTAYQGGDLIETNDRLRARGPSSKRARLRGFLGSAVKWVAPAWIGGLGTRGGAPRLEENPLATTCGRMAQISQVASVATSNRRARQRHHHGACDEQDNDDDDDDGRGGPWGRLPLV